MNKAAATKNNHDSRHSRGAVLLVMLIVIFTGTVLALGFLSRSDVQLAAGNNTATRYKVDYIAESGLEYAKGMILSPQDVENEYWSGVTGGQLVTGSDDFYDVNVTRVNGLDYEVASSAYKKKDSEKTVRSNLKSKLRIDPCICYYQQDNRNIFSKIDITGDIYCGGNITIYGNVDGDVYSDGWIADPFDRIAGSQEENQASPVSAPGISASDYSSSYYYNGEGPYTVRTLSSKDYEGNEEFPGPGLGNPAGVYYRDGTLKLKDTINIQGMLVVKNNLKLQEDCDITIRPVKNMPALIVGHDIKINDTYQDMDIEGYVQIGHHIDMRGKGATNIDIKGALFILDDGFMNTDNGSVQITAYPDYAALEIWTSSSDYRRWTPAAGAFFKNLQRIQ